MERSEFISIMNQKIKLIRTEFDLTQEKMADAIGISKKTLVEIEKGRNSLSWSAAVAAAVIFADSGILADAFGGETSDLVKVIALQGLDAKLPDKTMGGRIWWQDIKESKGYKIQQNIISRHYRILDAEDRRFFSSFDKKETESKLKELTSAE
ncbi:MAG: helix-turn-helix domain-containing protein [Saccharofermentans sp.]|nr:helix-turn-helix domain-containing protein [Saccharofermentans sp.]